MGYRGKVSQQEQARMLRADGMILLDIAHRLGVSKSSVSLWGSGRRVRTSSPRTRPPPRAQRLAASQASRDRRTLCRGRNPDRRLSDREFLVAGAALYAGEGAKGDGVVLMANTNPHIIAFFCAWLRRFYDIDETRLRVRLYLHQGLDLDEATGYWSALTGIPPTQFGKPYRAVPDPSIRNAKHPRGVATVRYSCSRTHRSIMGLVHALLGDAAIPG